MQLKVLKTITTILIATAAGCAPLSVAPTGRKPVRWIVVEKTIGDFAPGGRSGDGQVDPRAAMLTMQPLYAEDVNWEVVVDPHDFFVEVLDISPSAQASPGETVTARVRVGKARSHDMYLLTARASSHDVEVIGASEMIVRGNAIALFRFTSLTAGRGGIAVAVERVDGGHR